MNSDFLYNGTTFQIKWDYFKNGNLAFFMYDVEHGEFNRLNEKKHYSLPLDIIQAKNRSYYDFLVENKIAMPYLENNGLWLQINHEILFEESVPVNIQDKDAFEKVYVAVFSSAMIPFNIIGIFKTKEEAISAVEDDMAALNPEDYPELWEDSGFNFDIEKMDYDVSYGCICEWTFNDAYYAVYSEQAQ